MLDAILQFGSFLKWITPALSGVLLLPILFLILGRAAGSVAGKLSSGLDVVSSGGLVVSRIAAVLIIVSQLLIIMMYYSRYDMYVPVYFILMRVGLGKNILL